MEPVDVPAPMHDGAISKPTVEGVDDVPLHHGKPASSAAAKANGAKRGVAESDEDKKPVRVSPSLRIRDGGARREAESEAARERRATRRGNMVNPACSACLSCLSRPHLPRPSRSSSSLRTHAPMSLYTASLWHVD